MLALDDPRWHQLRTCYSEPDEFLPALARLWADPSEGPRVVREFREENHVCHQYTVSDTTVAVVPHFVHAAGQLPPDRRGELLGAAGVYALLLGVPLVRGEHGSPPSDIIADYERAVREGQRLLAKTLGCPWGESDLAGLMTAMAGFQGRPRLGRLLFRAVDNWAECPHCGEGFEPLTALGDEL